MARCTLNNEDTPSTLGNIRTHTHTHIHTRARIHRIFATVSQLIHERIFCARPWSIGYRMVDDASETNSAWIPKQIIFGEEFPGVSRHRPPHSDHEASEICRAPRDKSFSPMAESFPVRGTIAGSTLFTGDARPPATIVRAITCVCATHTHILRRLWY